jgi:hypothetical protein
MTSQINPNLINGAYPVAGQDNSTKGMRDNFTNIKTNFQAAAAEITALQNTVIVSGTDVVNNFDGARIYNAQLQNVNYAQINIGNAAPSVTVDYAVSSFQTIIANANTSISFTNLPAPGNAATMILDLDIRAADAVTQPFTVSIANIAVNDYNTGLAGLNGNTISFPRNNSTQAGVYSYQLVTNDGGASFSVTQLTSRLQPLNASFEDLASAGNVNVAVSDSYFSTAAAETSTLPAGVNGQVKVFAMYSDSGDMVITVTNAGWKTSGTGTITFDTIGDACTLKYINNKWFCIGNNGCVFA